uniref:Phosphatidylinositol transfer protein membrane associated 2 n=1 Tax=Cyprinus carpio TaxID=7962 RepID=A0A8C2ATS6_CYPCA
MLIKEYRIPMPMSVEEYRIAQLYMIQKKSREESEGEGSGVEIMENRPYTDGPGGSGQYTHKVYHIGQHIPSWFRSILPKAALRVEEESWNAYPYTRTRYTCPFVEKFSIDIETYYKPDTGCQNEVFNMSSAERRQRDIDPIDIVNEFIAPHEYLVEEDPKLYKSYKTQRGPLSDDWITEINNNPGKMPVMCAYKLCKVEFRYWGMQSKIERFIHDVGLRKVMVRAHRQAWCWQDEWYGLTMEDIRQLELETQLALAQKMAQYSCNEEGGENNGAVTSPKKEHEAKEAISSIEAEGTTRTMGDTLQARGELTKQWSTSSRSSRSSKRGGMYTPPYFKNHIHFMFLGDYQESGGEFSGTTSGERLNEDGSSQQCLQPSKIHVLILVLHGGNILDTGSGDQNSKQGDVNTISSAFDAVMRVHYPTALGRIAIRLVPCPAVCVEAFSLVSNLSPYSYDEGCLSNSQDHIPLAALPLLATSAPQYQDAVATVIVRANQVYGDFIKSLEGATFTGQVCLMGDCVGGILGFDALCSSNVTVSESQNSSRRGSIVSVQDNDLLSPGIIINSSHCSGSGSGSGLTLEGSRHLSRSNIDIPRSSGPDDPKKQLPRKRSDSSTYELDTIKQHQAFLTSLHSSVLRTDPGSRRSSSSTMLEGGGALGKFDFEVSDFFLFGSPLGLVLALRKTVVPALDVAHLRPACQQVYNLFHPADPSASRLEPLLEKRFHLMPPFSVPRYQRFPLGDGQSALLADAMQSHSIMFADHSNPSSPASVPAFRGARRASETSIASQVSGLVDSYTASNIANTQACQLSLSKKLSLLSQLALPYNKSGSRSSSPKSSKAQNKQQVERQDSSCLDDSEQIAARWWGTKRIDFALYCPDALTAFPTVALPHLFHASYWESTDVVSFLLRQVMRHENSSILELDGKEVSEFTPSKPREKWIRKRTHVKIRNVTANHRVNDAVFTEDGNQVVTGRFMYGPLDMVTLTGEKVDIHIMTQPPSGEWVYFSTELTNSSGRVSYTIPESKRLSIGVYPVKMVVRGDHTSADSYLTVLPRGTEFVVFSIDGSFAASVSIMGSDPKVRAGAVDVVRHWQDLGYLIVYVTGRPDMQKQRVVAWLSQHNFPHGIVSFCDGLVHDPLRHKANFLKSLITEAHMKIFAAYGSTKDISVYTSLGLPPAQIYIVGRPTKKMQHQCQFIADGYASHLSQLEYNQRSRPAKTGSTRMVLRKGSFGLGGSGDFLRKRNHLLRTISSQPTSSTPPVHIGRPERAQSQSECDRERAERAQRSMSIAAGCWGRTSRLEGGALSPK